MVILSGRTALTSSSHPANGLHCFNLTYECLVIWMPKWHYLSLVSFKRKNLGICTEIHWRDWFVVVLIDEELFHTVIS